MFAKLSLDSDVCTNDALTIRDHFEFKNRYCRAVRSDSETDHTELVQYTPPQMHDSDFTQIADISSNLGSVHAFRLLKHTAVLFLQLEAI